MPRTASPSIVTYRLHKKMVYVSPAESYEEAVDFAKAVFADELSGIDRTRVVFSINVAVQHTPRTVQIGPMAWNAVISTLVEYEIIDVSVQSSVCHVGYTDDTPPPYVDTHPKHSWSLSPLPPCRPHTPISPARSPSPGKGTRNWFERHFQPLPFQV
ncbi:hypothetical protein BKA93DRAFT_744178 [Sparassis latifolia]|uniref:Uncharacterized protein n=1 Tax=Sparassis crispa TaxID=139825 RepID=A0A401H2H0_9APHY|nr:hypothetical protein SCP_1304000 [Sparassis crispa]GBE88583.1 hypothetical protein SCP_1304000 [Sparassis crispa]